MTSAPGWTYQHAGNLRDHWWWRPGWRVGTRFYAWHITFDNQDNLHRLVSAYQHELSTVPGLDVIPRQWLHLTVQGIGFVDDVPLAHLTKIAEKARARLATFNRLSVQFHRPVIRPEAIALPPYPHEPLQRLRIAVREAIGDILGQASVPDSADGFQPHISLAYVSNPQPATDALRAIDCVRVEPVQVTVPAISVIEMHRDQRMYEWRTLEAIQIG